MTLEPEFLAPAKAREELVAELLAENAKAQRMLRKDSLSRESEVWANQHEHLNFLLTLLEE